MDVSKVSPKIGIISSLLAALALSGTGALAHDAAHSSHGARGAMPAKASPARGGEARVELRDLDVVDQRGRRLRFKTDVVGGRIVVMDFIYTTCTTVCPVSTTLLAHVHDRLTERGDQGVRFVSVSVDPVTDTPKRLRAYARKHGIDGGWTFLTGDKAAVDKVLSGLGAYTAEFRDHPAMVLVGDVGSGKWTRLFGVPDPDRIVAKVEALVSARKSAALLKAAATRE